jgi:hypothetical protein
MKRILKEAKSKYGFSIIPGAKNHKQLGLLNISGIWKDFIQSPLYRSNNNGKSFPQSDTDECPQANARDFFSSDDFELTFDEEFEFDFEE